MFARRFRCGALRPERDALHEGLRRAFRGRRVHLDCETRYGVAQVGAEGGAEALAQVEAGDERALRLGVVDADVAVGFLVVTADIGETDAVGRAQDTYLEGAPGPGQCNRRQ